ncbi:MAG TPA: cytochrome c [Anaerolineae bacterium]|nr:cytochrome c [Anaerolineae bacterium]
MSTFLKSIITWIVTGLILAGCGPGATAQPTAETLSPGDASRGQVVFEGTCSACHGPDAEGVAGLGKDLTTSEFVKDKTDADLVAFIKTGRPISDPLNTTGVEMPPRGGNPALTDQNLADVVAYLRTLAK